MDSQKGFVMYGAIAFIAMALLLMSMGWSSRLTQAQLYLSKSSKSQEIDQVVQNIAKWYSANAAVNSITPEAFSKEFLQSQFAQNVPFPVNIQSSILLGKTCTDLVYCVPYHVFAVWIAPSGGADTSSFNQATGVFIPAGNVTYRIFSSKPIQQLFVSNTISALNNLGTRLAQRFSAQFSDTPGFSNNNLFRAIDCSNPLPSEIPCVNTYQSVMSINLPPITGISEVEMVDAWGNPLFFSNLENSSTSYPFSASLQAITPWGQAISMSATQP